MKKILFINIFFLLILGCDYFESDYENFTEAYKNILIVRETYKNDSTKAEQEILKVYDKYGYTKESFKDEYFRLANENPRKFYELVDSVRERAKRETVKKRRFTE